MRSANILGDLKFHALELYRRLSLREDFSACPLFDEKPLGRSSHESYFPADASASATDCRKEANPFEKRHDISHFSGNGSLSVRKKEGRGRPCKVTRPRAGRPRCTDSTRQPRLRSEKAAHERLIYREKKRAQRSESVRNIIKRVANIEESDEIRSSDLKTFILSRPNSIASASVVNLFYNSMAVLLDACRSKRVYKSFKARSIPSLEEARAWLRELRAQQRRGELC